MVAESQEKFSYDADSLIALEKSISTERLTPYLALANGDRKYAILLYEWNTKLSEALYSINQGFEVTLRNAIHERMTMAFGSDRWYDCAPLQEEQAYQVQQAKQRIRHDGREITPGRVVAELMFGFWTSLAGTAYAQSLWDKHLHLVFREKRVGRKIVAKRLQKIRLLRNRVAHHESIIGKVGMERNLQQDVAEIIEATAWICRTTAKWITCNNTFDQHHENRPVQPSQTLPFDGSEQVSI